MSEPTPVERIATSIEEVPTDEPPENVAEVEGDDAAVALLPGDEDTIDAPLAGESARVVETEEGVVVAVPIAERNDPANDAVAPLAWLVRYTRDVSEKGSPGSDVRAVMRAIRKLTKLPLPEKVKARRTPGKEVAKRVSIAQEALGLAVTGSYDEQTHRALAPYFDQFGLWLLDTWHEEQTDDEAVEEISGDAFGLANGDEPEDDEPEDYADGEPVVEVSE